MTEDGASQHPETTEISRSERRNRGLERMAEVYNFNVSDGPGDFYGYTLEHLFGDIWDRPGLELRDRRLLLVGVLTTLGEYDTLDIQLGSALDRGDLTVEDLREITIFLTHYLGWPKGAALNTRVETAIHRHQKNQQ